MRWFSAAFFFLVFASMTTAETPVGSTSDLEGGMVLRPPVPAEIAKPRIDRLTWTLLAADGGARALDAYSTRRMLRNNCSSGQIMPGTSTCNYEQNLPGFIANHASGLYAFEGVAWLSEFTAARFLVRHHHERLARFVPLISFLSTTSFAVNNLTLSIGGNGAVAAVPTKSKHKANR
jgi:hypothetical protein